MNYCVIRDMVKLIDGSENPYEIMIQNAINAGFAENEVEILTEEEYQTRLENEPEKPLTKEGEIQKLKYQLEESDYMMLKCYEYQLAGKELPYNVEALHKDRQAMRDKINQLER